LAPLRLATADELARVTQRIAHLVALSPQPVPAGQLAARLRAEFAPLLDQWNGQASFKSFFRTLGLDHLLWITGSGGRLADPQRHSVPAGGPQAEAEPDSHWQGHEALFPLVREVSALTGAPLLPPQGLRAILDLLCEDLARQPYEPTETAQRIVAQCPARCGLAVGMREVVFILRGMQLNGHSFDRGPNDRATLVQRLLDQMLFLCQREQLLLDAPAGAQLRQWIGAEPAAGHGAEYSAGFSAGD
ncbi:MAG: NYN domain-containing protein, partial [Burkholderiales bacterium PBB5]